MSIWRPYEPPTARDYYREAYQKARTHARPLLAAAQVWGAQAQYILECWIQTGSNGGDNYRANCAEIAALHSWMKREGLTVCDDETMYHMAWFYNRVRRGYPIPLPTTAYDDHGRRDPRPPMKDGK